MTAASTPREEPTHVTIDGKEYEVGVFHMEVEQRFAFGYLPTQEQTTISGSPGRKLPPQEEAAS